MFMCWSCSMDMQIKEHFTHRFKNVSKARVVFNSFSLIFKTHPPDQNETFWLANKYMNN